MYAAYDRELTAIFEATRYFRYFLEGQRFKIVTDHKPLIYAFTQRSKKSSLHQQLQISYISQYTTDIEYIPGTQNIVADTLSRVESVRLPTEFSLIELAQAQVAKDELQSIIKDASCSLNLRKIQLGPDHTSVYCDLTDEALLPYMPASLRERVFRLFHEPAHPGSRITDRVIRKRYVWSPSEIIAPDSRFKHIHMDLIGLLPESNGFKYCLTIIDRFSRWPEAIPLANIEALTIRRAFVDHWISHLGAPETLTTDQCSQFESQLFKALLQLTGCDRIRTTAYHPQCNGMIAAIMCHSDIEWSRSLSTVLLGLRLNVMDSGSSPAEFLYGTSLRIPGEFVLPDDFKPNPHFFLDEFREHMRKVKPVPVNQKFKRKLFLFKDLKTCPHKILNRTSDRVFEIDFNGTPRQVSVESIKHAYFAREDIDHFTHPYNESDESSPKPLIL